MRRVCVYAGLQTGLRPAYADGARALGREIAQRGIGLVYGGANGGLMGALADAALDAGGKVTGIVPRHAFPSEQPHPGLTELRLVGSMHRRKAVMTDLSDAFIALPGGFGTLDEFFEAVTWAQIGLHQKPVGLLNIEGYFDTLVAFIEHACQEGFILPEHRSLFIVDQNPAALLDQLEGRRAQTRKRMSQRAPDVG
jgi:uncharacterized protein (TIGR00730 family)